MNGCTNLPSAYHTLDTVLGIRDTAMDNKDTSSSNFKVLMLPVDLLNQEGSKGNTVDDKRNLLGTFILPWLTLPSQQLWLFEGHGIS